MYPRNPGRALSKWLFTALTVFCLALGITRIGGQIRIRPPALAVATLVAPMAALFWWLDRGRARAAHITRTQRANSISLTHDGFKWLHGGRLAGSVRWSDVRGVAAFNRATIAVDFVMLTFRVGPHDEWISFHEGTDGFSQLDQAICSRFGVPRDWDSKVWVPPGELNSRRLWGDAPPPGELCWKCRYDLRGNESGVCPECGTVFVWPEPSRAETSAT